MYDGDNRNEDLQTSGRFSASLSRAFSDQHSAGSDLFPSTAKIGSGYARMRACSLVEYKFVKPMNSVHFKNIAVEVDGVVIFRKASHRSGSRLGLMELVS